MGMLKQGDFVKISSHGERFWVEVMHEHEVAGVWSGRVNNDLITAPYKLGDEIQFNEKEVMERFYDTQNRR